MNNHGTLTQFTFFRLSTIRKALFAGAVVLAALLPALHVMADSETVDGVTYTYSVWNGEAEIGMNEYIPAINATTAGALTIPSDLGGYPVTRIGWAAFIDCRNLTSITIPEGITLIDDCAFRGCSKLTSITIPPTVTEIGYYAFYGCSALRSITIPDGVTYIGDMAFYWCGTLTSITLPDSITAITSSAFAGCTNLSSIVGGANLASVGEGTFSATKWHTTQPNNSIIYLGKSCLGVKGTISGAVTIKVGTLSIADGAFAGCTEVTSVTMPDSVIELGADAFAWCLKLTNALLSANISGLKEGTFANCIALESLAIPSTLDTIGAECFLNCLSLTTLALPDELSELGTDAFAACTGLREVTIPPVITNLSYAFPDAYAAIRQLTLAGDWQFLPDNLLKDAASLESLVVPASVTDLGDDVFAGCAALQTIRYLGNAPALAYDDIYRNTPSDFVTEVMQNSTGWNGIDGSITLPSAWPTTAIPDNQRTIRFFQSAIVLDPNGGRLTDSAPRSLTAGATYEELPTPTRSGYIFLGWFTAVMGGEEITRNTTVPGADTTLYAQWAKIYTLTVKSGTAGGSTFFNGTEVTVTANAAPFNQEFQKWTVSPATTTFADGFAATDATTKIIMPSANLTMTAVFVKAPGSLGIEWISNVPGKTVSGVEWSTDKKTWYAADEINRFTSGAYTLYFRSNNGQWIIPASTKVTLNAGPADAPTLVQVACEFAPAFDDDVLADAIDPNSDYGYWDDATGQLDWTGLRVGLRAKLGPLPLQENATAVKLKSGKLPAGLKLVTMDGKVYLAGIPTKAGTYPAVLQAIQGKKLGALLPVTWTILDLPAEYIGTFNGAYTATTNDVTRHSALTLIVAKTGKLTGSVNLGGKKYSLKADAFDAIDFNTGAMSVTGTAFICTSPKLTNAISLTVRLNDDSLGMFDVTALPTATGDYDGEAVRNGWSDKAKLAIRTNALAWAKGYYTVALNPADDTYGAGYVTLTVDAKGAVKASGKLADGTAVSGSSVLLVKAANDVSAVIALSPSAYKGGEFYLSLRFIQNESIRVENIEPISWINTVTTKTSDGPFERMPTANGGWYSQLSSLYSVYNNAIDGVHLQVERIEEDVSLSFNTKGTGVDALPKADNAYNVKLTLTPKTGLFSGSFNETGVKTAYKLYGILTPDLIDTGNTAGLGFYSIPVTAPATHHSELFRLLAEGEVGE